MDAEVFDRLTRSLINPRPRRAVLGGVLAGLFGLSPAVAKKKHGGKKHGGKKHKHGGQPAPLPTPRCAQDDKPGCCDDATGQRLPGTSNTACGTHGEPCENCISFGPEMICRTDGGEPTCGCDVLICSALDGCCEAATRCVPNGYTIELCGTDGRACQTCSDGQICGFSSESRRKGRVCCGKEGVSCGRDGSITGDDFSRYCCNEYECVGDTEGNPFSGRCRNSFCDGRCNSEGHICCRDYAGTPFCCGIEDVCCPAQQAGQISFCEVGKAGIAGSCCWGAVGSGSWCRASQGCCANGRGCCGGPDRASGTLDFPECCDT